MKKQALVVLLYLISIPMFAQQTQPRPKRCGVVSTETLMATNPEKAKKRIAAQKAITQRAKRAAKSINDQIITIPVVVHVIYRTNDENISDAQIVSQIQVINEDFRRLNADRDGTWSQAADIQVEFCLATVDPNGNPTNGITRTKTDVIKWNGNDRMKESSRGGIDPWDTKQYLNMWVCNYDGLGYSSFPGESGTIDGVVMTTQSFGSRAKGSGFYLQNYYDLGRTTTHEIGHFLGLEHIWGPGDLGCSQDDFIDDTPLAEAPYQEPDCKGRSSCGSVDMIQNYMDYSDDACMNLFTEGQKNRMRSVLLGIRSELANSTKCSGEVTPPGPTAPINKKPTVSFVKPIGNTLVSVGYQLQVDATANDSDGTISKLELFIDDKFIRQERLAPYNWGHDKSPNPNELNGLSIGDHIFKIVATDDQGATNQDTFTLTVKSSGTPTPTPNNCGFGTPTQASLPNFAKASFNNVTVLGDGPDLSTIKRFRINWDASSSRLKQFAVNTKSAPYYFDLRSKITQSFGSTKPAVLIKDSGIGLDDDYWVAKDGDNFVMVAKSGAYSLYFNNSSEKPICNGAKFQENITAKITLSPNPASEIIQVNGIISDEVSYMIYDVSGKAILSSILKKGQRTIDVSTMSNGLYFFRVVTNDGVILNRSFVINKM